MNYVVEECVNLNLGLNVYKIIQHITLELEDVKPVWPFDRIHDS